MPDHSQKYISVCNRSKMQFPILIKCEMVVFLLNDNKDEKETRVPLFCVNGLLIYVNTFIGFFANIFKD